MGSESTGFRVIRFWRLGPHHFWLALFVLWAAVLSGALTQLLGLNAPGVSQLTRLRKAADQKRAQISEAENELIRLQEDAGQLEKNRLVQQREIRKVLGYAAPGELIFDFSNDGTSR